MPYDGAAPDHLRVYRATAEDIPFLVGIAQQAYAGYDLAEASAWAANIIKSDRAAIFFSGQAVAVVAYQVEFWRKGERIADVLPFFSIKNPSDPWAAYRVLKAACAWAQEQGCYACRFGSSLGKSNSTAGGLDLFAPFAKRMGATPWGTTYIKEF